MLVHLGCGTGPFPGWVNIDPRPVEHEPDVDVRFGDALHLGLEDESVDLLFSNAMFEHLFFGQLIPVLAEWKRVLKPDGLIYTIGIPDFRAVADLYLSGAQGVTGPRFDLFECFRYVHGWAEGEVHTEDKWQDWDVSAHPNEAPDGWLPQAHKVIYDAQFLNHLLDDAGLHHTVFEYAYPSEPVLNLGFLASRQPTSIEMLDKMDGIDQWITPGTVKARPTSSPSRMMDFAGWATNGTY